MRGYKLIIAIIVSFLGLSSTLLTAALKNCPRMEVKTVIPEKMKQGQNGYAILISKEIVDKVPDLKTFIRHKESRGFKVHLITSDKWGGGKGIESAKNIHRWLREHYQKLNLLYVLLIGNPNPDDGDLAHATASMGWTDWCYMDLDCDWTPALVHKPKKDQKKLIKLRALNGQWEVLVGRIPWYGEDSAYWKAADVSVVLKRIMRYENDKRDKSWRLNRAWTDHGDGSKKMGDRKFCDKMGANYIRLWKNFGDTAPPDGHTNEIKGLINEHQESQIDPIGFVNYHAHGGGTGVCGTIQSKGAEGLKDDYPAIHWLGSCSVGTPRNQKNLCGTIFRFNGIAVMGPSMSVTSPSPQRTKPKGNLHTGQSLGEYFWNRACSRAYGEEGVSGLNKTTVCYYLQGDPSVVPLGQRHGSPLQVSPYAAQYDKVVGKRSAIIRTYSVGNNTRKNMQVLIQSDVPWLRVSKKVLKLPPGKMADIYVKIYPEHSEIKYGNNFAKITVKSGQLTRVVKYTLEKNLPTQIFHLPFDKTMKGFVKNEDKHGPTVTEKVTGRNGHAQALKSTFNMRGRGRDLMLPGYNSFSLSLWFKGTTLETVEQGYSSEDQETAEKMARKAARKAERNAREGLSQIIAAYGQSWILSISNDHKITLDLICNRHLLPKDHEKYIRTGRELTQLVRGENWSDFQVKGPDYDKNKWNNAVFTIDRVNKKVRFFVNGVEYFSKQKFDFNVPLLTIAKKDVTFCANDENHMSFDQMQYFNYPISEKMVKNIYRGKFPVYPHLPYAGDKRPTRNATVTWEGGSPKAKTKIQYGLTADFKSAKTVDVTGKSNLKLSGLQNHRTYFWRIQSYFGNEVVNGSPSYFKTDNTVEIAAPRVLGIVDKKPPAFAINVAGAEYGMQKIVKDSKDDTLSYELISGPNWLTLTEAGVLFTPYGPKEVGESKLKFKVTDQTGMSVEREITVKAVQSVKSKKKK